MVSVGTGKRPIEPPYVLRQRVVAGFVGAGVVVVVVVVTGGVGAEHVATFCPVGLQKLGATAAISQTVFAGHVDRAPVGVDVPIHNWNVVELAHANLKSVLHVPQIVHAGVLVLATQMLTVSVVQTLPAGQVPIVAPGTSVWEKFFN